MATSTVPRRRRPRAAGGRPRLGRERHHYLPRVSTELAARLEQQAQSMGMPTASYLEVLVCAVHDTWTTFVQPPAVPLPTAMPVEEIQRAAAHFTDAQLYTPQAGAVVPRSVRVDQEVAAIIDARCDDYDVPYAEYLRAIFRLATGLPSYQPLAAAQPRLPEGGEAHLARAS